MPSQMTLKAKQILENPDFDYINELVQLGLLKRRLKELTEYEGFIGYDVETASVDYKTRKQDQLDCHRGRVRLMQFATVDYCLVVDLDMFRKDGERRIDWSQPGAKQIAELVEGPKGFIGQKIQFDFNFTRAEGLVIGGPIFDTMFAARVYNNGTGSKNTLGDLVKRNLNVELDKTSGKEDWNQNPLPEKMIAYAARDAIAVCLLMPELINICKRSNIWDTVLFELECFFPITEMSYRGMGFDLEKAKALDDELQIEAHQRKLHLVEELDKRLVARNHEPLPRDPDGSFNIRAKDSGHIRLGTKKYKGFNVDSPQQMIPAMENAGVMLPPNEKGNPCLDQRLLATVVAELKNEEQFTVCKLIEDYLEYKKSSTLLKHVNTLLKAAQDSDRICPNYNQLGTETGRLSCSEPNLQQIPKDARFRELIRARDGYALVVADFSQVELRVAADLSQEPNMIEAYRKGRDLHQEAGALMSGKPFEECGKGTTERQSAKAANFGLLFGAGWKKLAEQAAKDYDLYWTEEYSRDTVAKWRAAFPNLRAWQDEVGNRETTAIFTKTGRRRMAVGRSDKYTTRINTEVQGTAGDIAKKALLRVWKYLVTYPNEAFLIGAVHDEIILEVREPVVDVWKKRLVLAMENAGKELIKSVPIVAEVDSGPCWADAK